MDDLLKGLLSYIKKSFLYVGRFVVEENIFISEFLLRQDGCLRRKIS